MQKKLQFKFFIFIFLIGLLYGGDLFILYAQDSASNTQVKEEKPLEMEEHDTKDLEKLLKNYNVDQEKVIEDASKIHKIEGDSMNSEVDENVLEETRNQEAVKDAYAKIAKDKSQNELLKKIQEQQQGAKLADSIKLVLAPLQKMSENELLNLVLENSKDTQAGSFLQSFPKITLFAVRMIRDKDAVSSLLKILENHDKMIYFAGAMIATFILGYFLKRIFHKEKRSFLGVVYYFFLRFTIVNVVRVIIFYYFFSVEFAPTGKIIANTFF